MAETLANLRREILDAFASAEERGVSGAEPCDIVRGLVGQHSQMEFLTAKELLFLNKEGRSDLMADVDLIVRRAMNIETSMTKYLQMRSDFQDFLERNADNVDIPTGTAGGFSMSGKAAAIAQLKRHAMNDFLNQVRTMLDIDAPKAKIVANGYLRIARQHFGDDFPKFNLEWVDK